MGGKNQTTTQAQTNTPAGLSQLQDIWGRVQQVASQPYTPYGGQMVADLSPTQQAGIAGITNAQGSAQPYFNQAASYATQGASAIDPNAIARYQSPYTQQVVDATRANFDQDNARQQSQLLGNSAARGALGSRTGLNQAELARQQRMAQDPVIANLYASGYDKAIAAAQQDRAAAAQGAYTFGALAPSVQNAQISGAQAQIGAGGLEQGTDQAKLSAAYQQYLQQLAFPYQQAGFLASAGLPAVTSMGGSSTGQTTTPGPNPWVQAAGLGLSAASLFSDKRIKKNKREIGKTFDGQSIYSFTYGNDPHTHIGLMAQDVEKRHPEAVGEVGGIKTVNYETATDDAAERGRFASGGPVGFSDVATYVPKFTFQPIPSPYASAPHLSMSAANPMQSTVPSASQVAGGLSGMKNIASYFMPQAQGGNYDLNASGGGFTGPDGRLIGGVKRGGRITGRDRHARFAETVHAIRQTLRRGGAVRGYDSGGAVDVAPDYAPTFGGRWAAVNDALLPGANGEGAAFDPQGANAMGPAAMAPAAVPMPMARPAEAPTGPMTNTALPPIMAQGGPDATIDTMAYGDMRPSPYAPTAAAAPAQPAPATPLSAAPALNMGGWNPLSLSDDARMGLVAAGLGVAASKSPFALSAIGEGGLQGVKNYNDLTNKRRDAEAEARKLAQQASQFAQNLGLHRDQLAETKRQHDLLADRENNKLIGTNDEGFPVYVDARTGKERVGTTKIQGKTPPGYVRNGDGTMSPVKGGPADPEQLAAVTKAKATGGTLPDDTADFLAERILAGDSKALTNLGRGAQGAENIIKVQTLAARKATERGMNPSDILAKVAEQSGLTASQRTFGNNVARMAVNSTEAEGAIDLGRKASGDVPRTNWVPVNKAIQAYQSGTSDPKLAAFAAANLAIINTYSRAISPTGTPTVHDKEHAERLLSTATGPDAYNAVLDQMKKEIDIAHAAPTKAKEEMERIRKSGRGEPSSSAAPGSTPKVGDRKQFKDPKTGNAVWGVFDGTTWKPE